MTTPARLLAAVVAGVIMVLGWSATALADTPASEDWPPAERTTTLEVVLYFGGGTVGLIVAIWILALLLSRRNYVPPAPSTDLEVSSH